MNKYSNIFRVLVLGSLLSNSFSSALAVNALRDSQVFTQPDGSRIELCRVGDENAHYMQTTDNMIVLETKNGFEFATLTSEGTLKASGILATSPAQRRNAEGFNAYRVENQAALLSALRAADESNAAPAKAPKNFPGRAANIFPATGDVHTLVVLVEYQDVKFTLSDPVAYYNGILNTPGYSGYNATGAAKEYFEHNSNGIFSPTFDVYGPITLNRNRSYYGGNSNGRDANAYQMVLEAAAQLNGSINFSDYDTNGDGYVDNIFVVYAGQGEASYGTAETVWPHSSELARRNIYREFDGVFLNRYACTNEWMNGRPDGVGTFIHEMSHVLGLQDLYNTEDSSSVITPGAWSVMDYGNYNNNGCTPPNYSSFERAALGWIVPETISNDSIITLGNLGTSNQSAMLEVEGSDNEYFLFENRQKTGWDAYLPGHGMIVWHIDYDAEAFAANKVNCDKNHQRVDIIEACGEADSRNGGIASRYAWTGADGNNILGFQTTPQLADWQGLDLGLEIRGIAENEYGEITFESGSLDYGTVVYGSGDESGVTDAKVSLKGFEVSGKTVKISGEEIALYDMAGRKVANGYEEVAAPTPGFYIAATASRSVKINIR